MYAAPAAMYMTLRTETRITESTPEPALQIFRMIGAARFAARPKMTLKKNKKTGSNNSFNMNSALWLKIHPRNIEYMSVEYF